MDRVKRSYLYAIPAVIFWATIPTAFKIGLGELNILTFLCLATFTSTLALFAIISSGRKLHLLARTSGSELFLSVIMGLLNPTIYYVILLKAYQLLPGQIAQPLNMIWPIILVFLSVPVLRQKIPGKSFIALFISFAGVYIISSQGNPLKPGNANLPGVLLATGSSVFWAVYFILNMKDKRDESVKLFTNFLFASVFLAVTIIVSGKWQQEISLRGLAASVYVGFFEMGITFYLWLKALQLADTSDKVSNLVYLAPFISIILLYFIIHEPVYYTTPIGLVLIISGIYVQNRKTKIRV